MDGIEELQETIKSANRAATDQNNQIYEMLMDLMSRMKPPKRESIHPGQSEVTMELDEAMAIAQKTIQTAHKNANNPHKHSTYSDLASCWDACRDALSDNGLSIKQIIEPHEDKFIVRLVTKLSHKSGQWESSVIEMRCQDQRKTREDGQEVTVWMDSPSPQTRGAIITYARRYGLCAMVGIAPADNDAENNDSGAGPAPTGKDTKTPLKSADSKKPDEPKKETKAPPKKDDSGKVSEGNVNKLQAAMDKADLNEQRQGELLETFEIKSLADLPHAEFINFMQCIAKAGKILKEGK